MLRDQKVKLLGHKVTTTVAAEPLPPARPRTPIHLRTARTGGFGNWKLVGAQEAAHRQTILADFSIRKSQKTERFGETKASNPAMFGDRIYSDSLLNISAPDLRRETKTLRFTKHQTLKAGWPRAQDRTIYQILGGHAKSSKFCSPFLGFWPSFIIFYL